MNDLKLRGGLTAKFIGEDDWSRPLYDIETQHGTYRVCCVNLDGTHLHTMSEDGEPCSPVSAEYQPLQDWQDTSGE